jgi:uncharacterized protein YegP (UPF0339 family)
LTLGLVVLAVSTRTAHAQDGKLKFEVYKDAGGDYRWRLKSANGQILATPGQGYGAKADCTKAIDSIKQGAGTDKLKFETYQDAKNEHRWRLKAGNGQVIATSSESYAAEADCEKAIDVIKKGAKEAEVAEAT